MTAAGTEFSSKVNGLGLELTNMLLDSCQVRYAFDNIPAAPLCSKLQRFMIPPQHCRIQSVSLR
jgi:hypothetical protein